jgi:hypothetical protein
VETALPDPFDWSDPVNRTAWDFADPEPLPHQAAAMDIQRIWHRDPSSADHRSVDGQLERAKKQISIRGLNRNCNHDLKNLFKGAAIGGFEQTRSVSRVLQRVADQGHQELATKIAQ